MSQVILPIDSTQAWAGSTNPDKCFLLTDGNPCNMGSAFTRDDNGQPYTPGFTEACYTMTATTTVDIDFTVSIHDNHGNKYCKLIGGRPPKNP